MSNRFLLHDLIPQSFPFVMIDKLVSSDHLKTVTQLKLSPDNIFCKNDYFREPGIIENMAQTAAARSGFEAKKNQTKIKTGYIGSIKNFILRFLPEINQTIETEIIQKTVIGNISVVEGIVKCNEKIVATCEMTIIEMD